MGAFVRGDVVVVKYPFTTADAGKKRPALVVARNGQNDLLLCPITSQVRGGPFRIPIEQRDFSDGSLDVPSCEVKADILFTMAEGIVDRKAGRLYDGPILTVIEKIKAFVEGRRMGGKHPSK